MDSAVRGWEKGRADAAPIRAGPRRAATRGRDREVTTAPIGLQVWGGWQCLSLRVQRKRPGGARAYNLLQGSERHQPFRCRPDRWSG